MPNAPHDPTVHFRGVVLGANGFAMQGRAWLAALERAGFAPSLEAARLGDADEPLSPAELELLCRCSARAKQPGGVTVHHLLVPHFRPDTDARANVLVTMFDGAMLPPGWGRHASAANQVVLPTEWSMRLFAAAGVPAERLRAMAPPIDVDAFDPSRYPPRQVSRFRRRRWLVAYNHHARRGHDLLLQALGSTFRGEEAEVAILPDPHGAESPRQIERKSLKTLARYQRGQAIQLSAFAPASSVEDAIGRYAAADVFVLPCRGENWDRSLQEAMLMELPVITSASSALGGLQLDESTGYPVHSHLVAVEPESPEEQQAVQGRYTYEPTFDGLCQRLRQVHNNPDEASTRGRTARVIAAAASDPERVAQWIRQLVQRVAA